MDALMALDEAGYVNIVGLKGGYYAWNRQANPSLVSLDEKGIASLPTAIVILRALPNIAP